MSIPAEQYELYAEFGMAAEIAQRLEVAAGNAALSFITLFCNTDKISAEETEMFRSLTDDLNSKTLGRLLTHVKSTLDFDDTMEQAVDRALEKRNYLMHHFSRTHNFAIFSVEGRQAMVGELRDIRNTLGFAEAMLNAVSENLDVLAGRGGVSEGIAERLRAKGKRVKI
jgi:hypothetical protein